MTKTIKTALLIAAAAACISATPLAVSYAPAVTKVAQTTESRDAAIVYRQKLAGCQKQASDSYLHFLQRMSFISDCMSNS